MPKSETENTLPNNKPMNKSIEKTGNVQKKTLAITEDAILTEDTSQTTEKQNLPEGKILKLIKSILPSIVIAFGTFLLVFLLHYIGAFNTMELKLYDFRLKLRGPISGIDAKSALPGAEGFVDRAEPFIDLNNNSIWDEAELFTDSNGNRQYDLEEPFQDSGNSVWDEGEAYVDLDGNVLEWDTYKSIIRSCYKFTYEEVYDILEKKVKFDKNYLIDYLLNLKDVSFKLAKKRLKLPEIKYDEDNKCISLSYSDYSHQMIYLNQDFL